MAKAGSKSNTTDQVGTKKYKRKARWTDDPKVKKARRDAISKAEADYKAGRRAVDNRDASPTLEQTEWRALLDREREQRARLSETLPTGGEQHRGAVRAWWGTVSEVLKGIQNVTNWGDLPYQLFDRLAEQAAFLAVGQIPDPIKHVGGRGETAPGPGEISDKRWAVTYVDAVSKGLIRGLMLPPRRGRKSSSGALAVVCRLYKLRSKQTVHEWRRTYAPYPHPEAWPASYLRSRLLSAARRYRLNALTNAGREQRRKTKSK
jgi:hypothetical protein